MSLSDNGIHNDKTKVLKICTENSYTFKLEQRTSNMRRLESVFLLLVAHFVHCVGEKSHPTISRSVDVGTQNCVLGKVNYIQYEYVLSNPSLFLSILSLALLIY